MKNDPYQTTARYPSTCPKCGGKISKGDTIFIYPLAPRGKKAMCKCYESEFRQTVALMHEDSHGYPMA